MTKLGSDVDALDKIGNVCDTVAEVADDIRTVMQGIVIVLRAAEWFTGPWAEGLIEVLQNTVIPFLQRASAMLRAASKVLHAKAEAQRKVSAGEASQVIVTITYRSLVPAAAAVTAGAAAISASGTQSTTTFTVSSA